MVLESDSTQTRYILKGPLKTAFWGRIIAKGIDLFLVLIVSLLFYPFGILLGLAYLSVCDSLQKGQSVGKKFIGLGVISLEDGGPCTFRQSFVRNLPFSLPLSVAIYPFWGAILGGFLALVLGILELYLLLKIDSGHRLGDVMADTSVMAHMGPHSNLKKKQRESWFSEDAQAREFSRLSSLCLFCLGARFF